MNVNDARQSEMRRHSATAEAARAHLVRTDAQAAYYEAWVRHSVGVRRAHAVRGRARRSARRRSRGDGARARRRRAPRRARARGPMNDAVIAADTNLLRHLLLKERHTERLAQHRLETGMRIDDRLLLVATPQVRMDHPPVIGPGRTMLTSITKS